MTILALCMPERGHLNQMLPIISCLVKRGEKVIVMTGSAFEGDVLRVGATFYDLFRQFPIDAADNSSIPVPSRYVSFAGFYGEKLIEAAKKLKPHLILYETFAVAGTLIGEKLKIPYINVCAGHAQVPSRALASFEKDPRVSISLKCRDAIDKLINMHDISWANPFCYVQAISPYLNVYSQPPQYLPSEDREVFHPLVFFGSLEPERPVEFKSHKGFPKKSGIRIFISFGTVVWRYWRKQSLAAIEAIVEALPNENFLISMGGHSLEGCERLKKLGAEVVSFVDQWSVLSASDIFVCHHGFNSTHESIFHKVPMISYPFFGDTQSMARHAEKYGLSLAIVDNPLDLPEKERVISAVETIRSQKQLFEEHLDVARTWELAVIENRPVAIDKILSLKSQD